MSTCDRRALTYNPLHIDPESAKFGGFDEPILHGLCTFGHCGQLLLEALCGGDVGRFRKIKVRFSSPVMLNDRLKVRAWEDGPGRVIFDAMVEDRSYDHLWCTGKMKKAVSPML